MMHKTRVAGCVVSFLAALLPQVSRAQLPTASGSDPAADHASHATHAHHLAVFGGATLNLEKRGAHPSIGLDYVVRFSQGRSQFGIGVFGEAILASHTEWVAGGLAYLFSGDHLWLRTGPGIEFLTEEHEAEEAGDAGSTVSHPREFLYRVGVGYSLGIGRLIVAPSLDLDVVRAHTALVAGVNLGYGF